MNCPHCQHPLAHAKNFCSACGMLVGDFAKLNFEETNLTFLRADISGFTAMCEKMVAEDVVAYIDGVFSSFSEAVSSYRGYVYQVIGDEIVCVFGLDKSAGFTPHMAVLCAEEMVSRLQHFVPRGADKPLGLKMGCELDRVFVLSIQEDWRNSRLITEGFTKTQLLQKSAEENVIYVGEKLYQATKSLFSYREAGSVIKGGLVLKSYRYLIGG